MTHLHAYAQYICIVHAKYQKASVKAMVQDDFPVYALSKQKQNKHHVCTILAKAKQEKMAKFTKLSFCQKIIFGIKLLHANVQCVYII